LNTLEETDREPDILGASMLLEGQSEIFLLALEVVLAGNQTSVQNLESWLLICRLDYFFWLRRVFFIA